MKLFENIWKKFEIIIHDGKNYKHFTEIKSLICSESPISRQTSPSSPWSSLAFTFTQSVFLSKLLINF